MASSLPVGDSSAGLISIAACVRNFEAAAALPGDEFRQRARLLAGNAEELAKFCDPGRNASSYRSCQEAAQPASEGLLLLSLQGERVESRLPAFLALARLVFNSPENAATVAASEQCLPAVSHALRPIEEMVQQEEYIAALHLVQGLAATVPEAPCVAALLTTVAALATGGAPGFPACRAARIICLEVLASCAFSASRRPQVARALPAQALDVLMREADSDAASWAMPLGLLCACLAASRLHDAEGPTEVTIAEYCTAFWERAGFFHQLASCLEAALRGEDWPAGSGIYHRPWKLAVACRQLAEAATKNHLAAGRLLGCVLPLVALVEVRAASGSGGELLEADAVTASRAAVVALRALCGHEATATTLRAASRLPEALRQLEAEETAAREVLSFLEQGVLPEGVLPAAAADPFQAEQPRLDASGSPF